VHWAKRARKTRGVGWLDWKRNKAGWATEQAPEGEEVGSGAARQGK
jgi:hypothetical protein